MFQDLRFGWRILRTSKMLTLVAALSVGPGIMATSVIYALLDQLLINCKGRRDSQRLSGIVFTPARLCALRALRALRG